MSMIFDDTPVYRGMSGDHARVANIEGRVLIRWVDTMAEESLTAAFSPAQARALAEAILGAAKAAENDEAPQ